MLSLTKMVSWPKFASLNPYTYVHIHTRADNLSERVSECLYVYACADTDRFYKILIHLTSLCYIPNPSWTKYRKLRMLAKSEEVARKLAYNKHANEERMTINCKDFRID